MKHLCLFAVLAGAHAYAQSPEMRIVNSAVSAMGGKDRVLSVRTIKIYGYGQLFGFVLGASIDDPKHVCLLPSVEVRKSRNWNRRATSIG